MEEEEVMVVETAKLFADKQFQGFLNAEEFDYIPVIEQNMFFKKKSLAENDLSLKQIIPYVVFKHGDKIFVYKRTKKGGESRLHEKYSVGIGGHINPTDGPDFIKQCALREFNEELIFDGSVDYRIVGYINDDEVDVGKVHFGVVLLATGDNPEIAPREKEKIEGDLVHVSEAAKYENLFETWSKFTYSGVLKFW